MPSATLRGFALKRVGVGGQQVLEDTALERAEHRAKQVGVQARQLFQHGVGCGGALATPGQHPAWWPRVQGCGALALAATAGTAGPGSGGIGRCGSGRGDEESADMVVAIRPQAGCSSGRRKQPRIIPDFTAGGPGRFLSRCQAGTPRDVPPRSSPSKPMPLSDTPAYHWGNAFRCAPHR